MMKQMLGNDFKYEDGLLYKRNYSFTKTIEWSCLNYNKPNKKSGYIQVGVNYKSMYLNRLVYFFHYPDWDIHDSSKENQIDHINENKLDNNIENLRITNGSQNCQNKTHYGGKPIKGIYFHNNAGRKKPWGAEWCVDKKKKTKYFKTEIEAIEYRAKMVELHYTHHPSKRERKE